MFTITINSDVLKEALEKNRPLACKDFPFPVYWAFDGTPDDMMQGNDTSAAQPGNAVLFTVKKEAEAFAKELETLFADLPEDQQFTVTVAEFKPFGVKKTAGVSGPASEPPHSLVIETGTPSGLYIQTNKLIQAGYTPGSLVVKGDKFYQTMNKLD